MFYFMNTVKFKARLRKFGTNRLDDCLKNRIRYSLMFFANATLSKHVKMKKDVVQQHRQPLKVYF